MIDRNTILILAALSLLGTCAGVVLSAWLFRALGWV
jgi:cation transporter-like permease